MALISELMRIGVVAVFTVWIIVTAIVFAMSANACEKRSNKNGVEGALQSSVLMITMVSAAALIASVSGTMILLALVSAIFGGKTGFLHGVQRIVSIGSWGMGFAIAGMLTACASLGLYMHTECLKWHEDGKRGTTFREGFFIASIAAGVICLFAMLCLAGWHMYSKHKAKVAASRGAATVS